MNQEDEIAQINALAGKITGKEMATRLQVSYSHIKRIAKANKISLQILNKYDDGDDLIIAQHINTMSYHDIGVLLKRSGDSVRMRASLIGLAGEYNRKSCIDSQGVKKNGPNKSTAIKWSKEDIQLIVNAINEGGTSYQKLGEKLGRTADAVRFQYKKYHQKNNISTPANKKKRKQLDWDTKEIDYLISNMRSVNFSLTEVALTLGRTYESVRHKYRKLKFERQV